MSINREELEKTAARILKVLQYDNPGIEAVEVNVFASPHAKQWRDLNQTARAGTTHTTHTSAMEISSAAFTEHGSISTRAHSAFDAFRSIDASANGLTLSAFCRDDKGKLVRQSVNVGHSFLPPEPPQHIVTQLQHEERNLVNDPMGLGMGIAFPS